MKRGYGVTATASFLFLLKIQNGVRKISRNGIFRNRREQYTSSYRKEVINYVNGDG